MPFLDAPFLGVPFLGVPVLGVPSFGRLFILGSSHHMDKKLCTCVKNNAPHSDQ